MTIKSVFPFLIPALLTGFAVLTRAAVGGSISGTVRDRSGAVIPRAVVTAINLDTGVRRTIAANNAGVYSFPALAVGHYDVNIAVTGFKPYRRAAIAMDVNSALLVDAVLDLGESSETVTVGAAALGVETANTQLGDVITAATVAALPLNGRSYTDLLAMQPGVTPVTTITSLIIGAGVRAPSIPPAI